MEPGEEEELLDSMLLARLRRTREKTIPMQRPTTETAIVHAVMKSSFWKYCWILRGKGAVRV